MGMFKKTLSETDKQLWAIGLMGHHLKSRDAEVIDSIGGAIGRGILFASPSSIALLGAQAWDKANGHHMAITGLSEEGKAKALADFGSSQHSNAKKKLLDVLLERNEMAVYLVVPVYARELVSHDLPEDFEWMDVDSAIRELAHFAADCLRDAAGSFIDSNGKYGSTAYEFVLNSLCYAGAVLRPN